MGGARTLLVILFAFGILLFGCCGSVPTTQGTSPTGGQAGGAGTGTTGGGTGGTNATGTTTGGTGGTGTTDLTGMAYGQLIALGIPIQCDMTTNYEGKATTIKVYMNGANEVREEVPVDTATSGNSGCTKYIIILKGTTSYMGCEGGSMFGPTCDWLTMEITPSGTTEPTAPTAPQPDLGNVPAAQISCTPWVYDASKFTVTGKTCTLQDLMGSYQYP